MKSLDGATRAICQQEDTHAIRTKNAGVFIEKVRAEQLCVRHPSHLLDIGIFRSILSKT